MNNNLIANQNDIDKGFLKVRAFSSENLIPIDNARIEIAGTGNPDNPIIVTETDQNGLTENIELEAPPLEYSLEPSDNQPYSEYNVKIYADDYDETIISGVQILSGEFGIQNIEMNPSVTSEQTYDPTVIAGHTLWEFYPPKIAEAEIKPMDELELEKNDMFIDHRYDDCGIKGRQLIKSIMDDME